MSPSPVRFSRFRALILGAVLLALSIPSFAAWGCESAPGVTLTDDIYWASQPPAVRVFKSYSNPAYAQMSEAARSAKAIELAAQGYKIDVPIMVWGWDPVCTMLVRVNQGYTWVPSALEPPVYLAPGLEFPGLDKYDPNHPSPQAIKVSIKAEDFPAFDPPAPVVNSSLPIVGQCFVTWCGVGPGGLGVSDGQEVVQSGQTYRAKVSVGLMGKQVYFIPLPPK